VEDGSLLQNPALVKICKKYAIAGQNCTNRLTSKVGVHSHLSHLLGLLDLAKAQGINNVCIHAITDGRDTSPNDGIEAIEKVQKTH
jgi:2,3-bisphosphoglycerate-independent phosphoglycerate mutase